MSNANRIVLWLLGALLLGGVLWYANWFAANFERQSREVRTDISPEARKNRYLAAEQFLREGGRTVLSHAGRDIFSLEPAVEDTIFLGSNSQLFLERNHDALLAWVEAGGHLVLVPPHYDDDDDDEESFPLLEQLGVELVYLDEDEYERGNYCRERDEACDDLVPAAENESESDSDNNDDTQYREKKITAIFTTDYPGEFKARFLADRYLYEAENRAGVVIGDGDLPNLLVVSLGSGSVTLLSDSALFTNEFIGEYDHAYLFHRLVNGPGRVWIFYSADMPSLLALLWQRTPWLLLISVTLLMMAGWRMLLVSGPKFQLQYDPRRNLLEHLDASANYSWRIDKARRLFSDNRHAVEQAWRRCHPQLNSMSETQCCAWIGEKTGITAAAIQRTLYGEIASEQDFIRASSVLQRLATRVNQHTGSASANRS